MTINDLIAIAGAIAGTGLATIGVALRGRYWRKLQEISSKHCDRICAENIGGTVADAFEGLDQIERREARPLDIISLCLCGGASLLLGFACLHFNVLDANRLVEDIRHGQRDPGERQAYCLAVFLLALVFFVAQWLLEMLLRKLIWERTSY